MSPLSENQTIVAVAKKLAIDFAIIGPENPLENGLVDALEEEGFPCVAPKKDVARIETSKSFARNILDRCSPEKNPKRKEFSSLEGVERFLQKLGGSYVVKYDGLMGGKGVKVSGEHLFSSEEALGYCKKIINMGGTFLVEEKLVGEEFSLMSFCDGKSCAHMPAVQDHKRAFEGDVGPNTGGMGTYSFPNHSLPFLSKKDISDAQKTNEKVAKELYRTTGTRFKGFLYGGFMATKGGIKVIEYNARLGDPEAMNVLSLLKTDFFDICNHILDGSLKNIDVKFEPQATVCKYAVPNGYPDSPEKGFAVSIENVDIDSLFFAAVKEDENKIIATGSRTVACVGVDKEVSGAEQKAEVGISRVVGNVFHRKDIGTAALIQKRIENMKKVRQ
jgi:phosphoribosylamine--glycine ligase